MQCPVCKKPMITIELNNVEIDYCLECGGIWLDHGEFEQLISDDNYLRNLKKAIIVIEKKRRCPVCNRKMKKYWFIKDEKVLIDVCPKGHGIWFDFGELYNIISQRGNEMDNKVLSLLKEMFKYKLEDKK